ncbi:hypothetical protein KJZ67_04915 [Patescibacteria group bacterium]|nr:hypothetical protein [Patescibacteria group bacterium]
MLAVLIVCKKIDNLLIRTIKSVEPLRPQILIDISDDQNKALGERKNRLINRALYEWVLVLDTDEVVSKELLNEVREIVRIGSTEFQGYQIPYRNYIFGKHARHGGENYSRTQLFRKKYGSFSPLPIHEYPVVKGKIGKLKGVIHHYSYVSLPQVLRKFTKYAWQMAGEKQKAHEQVTLKKLFFYGPHMVWARAIKDHGWRDGWQGIVLALCFGYMETLMYWMLIVRNLLPPATKQS